MSKARYPPRFITGECFTDNLTQYGDTIPERLTNWLASSVISSEPVVISPLHTPDDGRKPHCHFIIDVTNCENRALPWFEGLFKSVSLPRPENVRNIISMELYLTHDTAQARKEDKQTFTPDERDTMVFLNGYAMHELTDRASREETTKLIGIISQKIEDYLENGGDLNTRAMARLLRNPDFYIDIDTPLCFDLLVAKARNELKVHYRYYLQYLEDVKNEQSRAEYKELAEKQKQAREELREDNAHFCSYLCSLLASVTERDAHNVFNAMYCNDRDFRANIINMGVGDISQINHKVYLESYIMKSGVENQCSDRLVDLSAYLQKYTTECFLGLQF